MPYNIFSMFCLDEVVGDGEKGVYKDCTVDRAPLRYKTIMYNQECSTTENYVINSKMRVFLRKFHLLELLLDTFWKIFYCSGINIFLVRDIVTEHSYKIG